MEIIIRPMQPSETKEVRQLAKRVFGGIEQLFVSKPKEAFIAVDGEKIVGGVMYRYIEAAGKKVGYVDYAFIETDYQGKGIGSRLYKHTKEHLLSQGCDALSALVEDDNVASWGLFLKSGFSRVGIGEVIKQLGFVGFLAQYFRTPWCVAGGMDFYLALNNGRIQPREKSSAMEMLSFLFANGLILLLAFLMGIRDLAFLGALLTLLATNMVSGKIGSLFTKREWSFRFNTGGGAICFITTFVGGFYPMMGNWYPSFYEDSKGFRRDLGIVSLVGWITVLAIMVSLSVLNLSSDFASYLIVISEVLLIYRMIAVYPFASFGGMRVYKWNKGIYALMVVSSISALLFL